MEFLQLVLLLHGGIDSRGSNSCGLYSRQHWMGLGPWDSHHSHVSLGNRVRYRVPVVQELGSIWESVYPGWFKSLWLHLRREIFAWFRILNCSMRMMRWMILFQWLESFFTPNIWSKTLSLSLSGSLARIVHCLLITMDLGREVDQTLSYELLSKSSQEGFWGYKW